MPIVENAGPLDYCLSPVITPPSRGYVFSASASANDLAAVAVRYLRNRGWKRIAMIAGTDSARMPSGPRIGPIVGRPPGALASVLMQHSAPPSPAATLRPRLGKRPTGANLAVGHAQPCGVAR